MTEIMSGSLFSQLHKSSVPLEYQTGESQKILSGCQGVLLVFSGSYQVLSSNTSFMRSVMLSRNIRAASIMVNPSDMLHCVAI